MRRIGKQTKGQASGIELNGLIAAADQRWSVPRVDVMKQSKLLVKTPEKGRRGTHTSGCLNHHAIQFERKLSNRIGDVCILVCKQWTSSFRQHVLQGCGNMHRLIALPGDIRQQEEHPRAVDWNKVEVIPSEPRTAIQGRHAQ